MRKQGELRREVADLKDELGDDEDSPRLDRLESELASQRLVVSTMAQRYSTESSQQQQVQNVGVLADATTPTSDRDKQVAIFAFTGAVAGLLLGLLLASARMRRKERRASQDARAD